MSTIDNRIVNMIFNNKQFERGIRETTDSLNKLDSSLNVKSASSGLKKMGEDVESISGRFSNMGIVGMTVLEELTKSAMRAGTNIARSLLDPILAGGKRRALNIEQAKFQFEGLGMSIEDAMASANEAVSGTAFGLDEAAKVAAQFGASGMEAGDDMTQALRAISGVAAMTSSSYEDIGRVFTSVSGNGRLMGNQLLQLSGRGLNAAAAIAKSMGISEGAVREMVTKGEIDFETFYKAMDEAFGEHATAANKTFTGSLSNMRAALSRLGASIYTPALENLRDIFNAMRPVIDGVHEALKPLIDKFTEITTVITKKLVKALESISFDKVTAGEKPASNLAKAFNGLKAAIEIAVAGIKLGVKALGVLARAFSPIFKPIGALIGFLGELVVSFRDLVLGTDKVNGVFAPFKAVTDALSDSFGKLRKDTDKVSDGFRPLEVLGNAIKKLFEAIAKGAANLGPLMAKGVKQLMNAIKNIDLGSLTDIANVGIFAGIFMVVKKFFSKLASVVGKGGGIIDKLLAPMNSLKGVLESYQKSINADTILKIAGALAILSGSLFILSTINPTDLTGSVAALSMVLVEMVGALKFMSSSLDPKTSRSMGKAASTMIKMSIAITLMSVAMKRLGDMDLEAIGKGTLGLAGMLGMLTAAAIVLSKQEGRMMKGSAGLIAFAGALRILVPVVERLGALSVETLIKGLGALGIVLLEVAAFTKLQDPAGMLRTGAAMTVMGSAMKKFADAVAMFGSIGVNQLVKGLGALGIVLLEISIFTKLMDPKKIVSTSVGLVILAGAMKKFAEVVGIMGDMRPNQLTKGMMALGSALTIVAVGMRLMPTNITMQSIALVILAKSMITLSEALTIFGSMSVKEIAKGLGTLAGALVILAGSMRLMQGTLSGAAAMVIAAKAINMLVPSLEKLGALSVKEIAKSLGTLAGALAILTVAGFALAPVVPVFLSLATAIGVFGLATVAIGAGVLALSGGLAALTLNSAATTAAFSLLLKTIIMAIPNFIGAIASGLVEFAVVLAESGEKITKSVIAIGTAIFEALSELIPKAAMLGLELMIGFMTAVRDKLPEIMVLAIDIMEAFLKGIGEMLQYAAFMGFEVMIKLLKGIGDGMTDLVGAASNIIVAFLEAIADELPRVIEAGFNLIIAFINGIADSIRNNHKSLIEAGTNLIDAILGAVVHGLVALPGIGLQLITTFAKSIRSGFRTVRNAGDGLGARVLDGIRDGIKGIFNAGVNAVKSFISGIKSFFTGARKAGKDGGEKAKEGVKSGSEGTHSVGKDMMSGFSNGISSMAGSVASAAKNVASGAVSGIKSLLNIQSPSRVMMGLGVNTGEGFANGIESMSGAVKDSSSKMASGVTEAVESVIDILDEIDENPEFSPKISPIVDMDSINEANKQLDKMGDDRHAIRSISSLSAVDKANTVKDTPEAREKKAVINNYTQNNYSPKALSRLEIYRQTRNQLALEGDGV